VALSFLIDRTGDAVARREWNAIAARNVRDLHRILAHLVAVDLGGSVGHNLPLARAQHLEAAPDAPPQDPYWWQAGDVGIVYAYDGSDTIVVLVAMVGNPPSREILIEQARARI
jgi:hypothetical protein